jgi:hypothetical protein
MTMKIKIDCKDSSLSFSISDLIEAGGEDLKREMAEILLYDSEFIGQLAYRLTEYTSTITDSNLAVVRAILLDNMVEIESSYHRDLKREHKSINEGRKTACRIKWKAIRILEDIKYGRNWDMAAVRAWINEKDLLGRDYV